MFKFIHVFVIVIVLLVLLIVVAKYQTSSGGNPSENFDTYYQHDAGVAKVLGVPLSESMHLVEKYDWYKRTPEGYNLYDVVYNNLVRSRDDSDQKYTKEYLGLESDYDSKFDTLDDFSYGADSLIRMKDPQLYTNFRGHRINLQQK
jgi:hypothetical protein